MVGKSKQMCYHIKEVRAMENEKDMIPEEQVEYAPRPRWQVWLARIGLVVFVVFLIFYYINWFRGGA